mmetsp:Transcript_28253/g.65436  ORF Transcript_28253/g.65436 Transcript_28253/m.65436 type:complete len:190 (+) Transcript_28253:530-1099(+)
MIVAKSSRFSLIKPLHFVNREARYPVVVPSLHVLNTEADLSIAWVASLRVCNGTSPTTSSGLAGLYTENLGPPLFSNDKSVGSFRREAAVEYESDGRSSPAAIVKASGLDPSMGLGLCSSDDRKILNFEPRIDDLLGLGSFGSFSSRKSRVRGTTRRVSVLIGTKRAGRFFLCREHEEYGQGHLGSKSE